MTRLSEIAEDMRKHCGALVSVSSLARYAGISREKARSLVFDLVPCGQNSGKRYFYLDVAKKIAQRLGGIKNV
ncbi:MAG: hypothetical protein ACOX7H_06390 [Bacillota bacterium]|jgi:hypothetical protein